MPLWSEESLKAQKDNLEIAESLWEKAGVPRLEGRRYWSYAYLRENLDDWEFKWMVAHMHNAVSDNGGWVHGMHCYFDVEPDSDMYIPPEDLIQAWREIGSEGTCRAIEEARSSLKKKRRKYFGELKRWSWERLERKMEKAYGDDQPAVHVLMYNFAKANGWVEQGGGAQSPTQGVVDD